jgi:protein-tyrosine phosphatase
VPAVIDERRVPLAGAMNFRDVGGYPAAGGVVARGQVYRSDHLALLTDADVAVVAGLGLRTVYDLRRDREVAERPSRLPDGLDVVRLPMADDTGDDRDFLELILAGELPMASLDFMVDVYHQMLDSHGPRFARLFEGLADPRRRPAVFHCTAGKDRTGMAAVLLLDLLGVDEAIALDDYELTNEYRSRRRIEELRPQLVEAGVDVDAILPLLSAPRPAMEDALTYVHRSWGTAEGYLISGGLDPAAIDALRRDLVVPA